jgi:hypothetical protein
VLRKESFAGGLGRPVDQCWNTRLLQTQNQLQRSTIVASAPGALTGTAGAAIPRCNLTNLVNRPGLRKAGLEIPPLVENAVTSAIS